MADKRPRGYQAAHMRVRRVKGRAADQRCSRCPRPAVDWCFTGEGSHSDDPDDYVALCRGCHRQMDSRSHGEQHPSAKLTDADVRAIRALADEGTASQRELARRYGVTQAAIYSITARKTWKHIA